MNLSYHYKGKSLFKIFAIFLCVHFAVWVLVPLLRPNIPMDSAEAIVWGAEWTFGTNKHPYLSGWLAEISHLVFQNPDVSVYVLSQICVLIGFIYIYKIARLFLSADKALLSVLFLEGTIYYSICSIEFNVNVLSLAIVPAMTYYFYRALDSNRIWRWVLTGALMGLALMTKYTNGIFLIAMGLYLIATKQGRAQFKKTGMYFAGAVCLLVCLPHIYWLVQNDFFPFEYLLSRASNETPSVALRHFAWPLKFAVAQVLAMALTLIGFGILCVIGGKVSWRGFKNVPPFLIFMGFFPLLIWILISATAGIKLKSMWGFAFVSLIPMILFYVLDFKDTLRLQKRGVFLAYVMMGVMAAACIGTTLCHTSERANFPGRVFAAKMEQIWSTNFQMPLKYTGGDIWFSSLLYVYLQDKPRALIQMNPSAAPWIDVEDVKRCGAIVMADNISEYKAFQNRIEGVPDPTVVPYKIKSRFGKEKTVQIHYGIIPPAGIKQGKERFATLKGEEINDNR